MYKVLLTLYLTALIASCGGSSTPNTSATSTQLNCTLNSSNYSFQDQDPATNFISGHIIQNTSGSFCNADRFSLRWEGSEKELSITAITVSEQKTAFEVPISTPLPTSQLTITPMLADTIGSAIRLTLVDLVGVSGPGGNVKKHWEYGVDRSLLMLSASSRGETDYCKFDNGNVLIHDAEFQSYDSQGKGVADDILYPAYEFDCTEIKANLHRAILWANSELGQYTHTYSTINDSMYYGNITFNVFEKYLGQRPFEKLRIRVHHGDQYNLNASWANWNGAYINLNDATYHAYGMASLDIIAHEAAHGILQTHSALKHAAELEKEYTPDARTVHEAYADIASVVAHYAAYKELDWEIGEENFFAPKRFLHKVETQPGAILSYLDYQAVKNDSYKKIGIITYPFYILSNEWGIEKAFQLFTDSALNCWKPNEYLPDFAICVKETAAAGAYNTADVIDAFRAVKLQLKEEDTFAHFTVELTDLGVQFNNLSETDRTIVRYQWTFGDGQTSTEKSPYHDYTTSSNYVVTLEVEDNLGTVDSLTRTLELSN